MIDGSRSLLWRVVDAAGIDGIVNGTGKTARNVGDILKRMQSGSIRSYAAWVVLGSIMVIVAIGIAGGLR
jgi:NADH-quinone oxidoreductase subunit L